MTYTVKECFYTLQGEGFHAGRPAVFLRFSGCNLWTGREADRASAVCQFCDTDFVGVGPDGGKFETPAQLADHVAARWPEGSGGRRFVVCTGGEPLLQLDAPAIKALHDRGFSVAVETNGTQPAPLGLDWICVSPKAGSALVLRTGHELKLVYPQTHPDGAPGRFAQMDFTHFFLQPMDAKDAPTTRANTEAAIAYCLAHPAWRLGVHTHKAVGIR